MLTDQQLGDTLSQTLHDRTSGLWPRAGLAERVIRRRRAARRRFQLGAIAALVAVAAISASVLRGGHSAVSTRLGSTRLRLASYTFNLPQGARAVPATPAACAIGVGVGYNTSGPGEGASTADQPAIAQAVTSNGGCVSMLLTDPYTPGAANAPSEPWPVVDQHDVRIGSDTATIGTYRVTGGPDMTFGRTPVPNGTEHVVLTVELPAVDGQVQELQVAVAGISEQQLVSIVASGLTISSQ